LRRPGWRDLRGRSLRRVRRLAGSRRLWCGLGWTLRRPGRRDLRGRALRRMRRLSGCGRRRRWRALGRTLRRSRGRNLRGRSRRFWCLHGRRLGGSRRARGWRLLLLLLQLFLLFRRERDLRQPQRRIGAGDIERSERDESRQHRAGEKNLADPTHNVSSNACGACSRRIGLKACRMAAQMADLWHYRDRGVRELAGISMGYARVLHQTRGWRSTATDDSP
jgi:hypothetical protein